MVAAVVAAAAAMGGAASAAEAADGDLYIEGCVARTAIASCPAGLPGLPIGIAQSPDGRHLYAGIHASGGGSFYGLQILDRNPQTGVATPRPGAASCFAAIGSGAPCTLVAGALNLSDAFDVAVSPDGRNVYLAALNRTLLNFARDPDTGALAYVNCVGPGIGCSALTANAGVQSVAVSRRDSSNVYLKTTIGLAVLDRNAGTGALTQKPTFSGCFSEGNVANCTDVDGLAGTGYTLVVSPDDAHVYVAFDSPGGVSIFKRAADGTLAQTTGPAGGCISANGASGGTGGRCVDGNDGLGATYAVTVSEDGRSVYVGGYYGVTSYHRDAASGGLTQIGCHGPVVGCAPVAAGVFAVFDLAVTPDGDEVISAAHGSESVVSFRRDPATGVLAPRAGARGCLTRTGNAGTCLTLPLLDNDHHVRVAMDPSGLRFYVASRAGMIATVTRDFTPVCESIGVDVPFNTAVSVPLTCKDANGDAMSLEKVGLPAVGQLGEINNGAVFYNPFGNYIGADSFTYRAVTPSRGVAGQPATISVNVAGPLPAGGGVVLPSGIDGDRDGFSAGQDCNDSSAAIRPGAQEVKGNRTDENCDGTAEPFPTLSSGVVTRWSARGSALTLSVLQVTQQFPRGWKAKILCKGSRCPFRSKSLKAGKVRRSASTIISSLSSRQRRFRAGQTVEVWVSAPAFNTKVARFVLKKGRIPTTQPFCVLPGQTRPQKTCT